MANALARLQSRIPAGRIVDPDDLHLTLVFLEDAGAELLHEVDMGLDMASPPRLSLRIAGLGTFGSDPPRMLHAQVEGGAALADLQRRAATLVRRAGGKLPHSRFVPHVTLARFRRTIAPEAVEKVGRFMAAHGDWAWGPFAPAGLTLYRSSLTPEGPVYEALSSYPTLPA